LHDIEYAHLDLKPDNIVLIIDDFQYQDTDNSEDYLGQFYWNDVYNVVINDKSRFHIIDYGLCKNT